jgi:outer membrane protein OmpA-like peptidoglycan-associated protein
MKQQNLFFLHLMVALTISTWAVATQPAAAAVKNWLAQNGKLGARRMSTHGFGEQKPVAPNAKPDGSDDPEGRQKNRRVEITVKK